MGDTITVQSWKQLVESLRYYEGQCEWACRGESYQWTDCKPSIDRISHHWANDTAGRLILEDVLTDRFISQAAPYLQTFELGILHNPFTAMMLMRHFGAPTRLMDWSGSLWVAAYFAAAKDHTPEGDPKADGRIRFFDKYQLEDNVGSAYGTETQSYDKPSEARAKANNGLMRLFDADVVESPDWHSWLVCQFMLNGTFPRMTAQQGFFTMASKLDKDHWTLAKEMIRLGGKGRGCHEIRIERAAKPEILHGLARMGITAASLYPGLEGIGMSLTAFALHSHLDNGVKRKLNRDWRSKIPHDGAPSHHSAPPSA